MIFSASIVASIAAGIVAGIVNACIDTGIYADILHVLLGDDYHYTTILFYVALIRSLHNDICHVVFMLWRFFAGRRLSLHSDMFYVVFTDSFFLLRGDLPLHKQTSELHSAIIVWGRSNMRD